MTRLGFAFAMVAVVAAAAWAYNVNYKTKTALGRVDDLRAEIAAEREAVEVLRVEWAYLNAPDRLARLVASNNDRLDLVPMAPGHFDEVAAVPFPPNPALQAPETEPDAAGESGQEGPGEAPAPAETAPEPPLVISERAAPVSSGAAMPLPAPRPASWRPQ